jgi:hypothetical protein
MEHIVEITSDGIYISVSMKIFGHSSNIEVISSTV